MKRIFKKSGSMYLFLAVMFIFSATCFGQQKKADTVAIKTSAVCGMCKDRIEGGLVFEKGVKSALLDVETKMATVVFNPAKTSPEKLRKTISMLGYDADTLAANTAAYNKLPACCKKDAPPH
ncbi:MAG: heavy metal-associated domain-containing protein [Bacteroidales bacterium]|nr:heavy metal-associated domain-containing protein [Bacteroidales bacterium]